MTRWVPNSQFLDQLEATTLPPAAFDHAGHIRAAWLCFAEDPETAEDRFCIMLKRYAASLGAPEKYHETITRGLLAIIQHRMTAAPTGEDWDGFAARNADLFEDALKVLAEYYTMECLFSDRARTAFLCPDRARLPGRSRPGMMS